MINAAIHGKLGSCPTWPGTKVLSHTVVKANSAVPAMNFMGLAQMPTSRSVRKSTQDKAKVGSSQGSIAWMCMS